LWPQGPRPWGYTPLGFYSGPFFAPPVRSSRAFGGGTPPAPAATTISTGLVGSQACAGAPSARTANVAPPHKRKRLLMVAIFVSLAFLRCRPTVGIPIHATFCAFVQPIQAQNRRSAKPAGAGSLCTDAVCKDARDMHGLTAGAVLDLVTAGRAVGHDEGIGGRFSQRRQQRHFGHGERNVDGLRVIAEAAGHAAATRFDGLDLEVGNEFQRRLDRSHSA